ncbi:hypothetical protein GALL_477720 [mine drainage metagenome]|uniref:Uncharacterized protein n=1 Tax=mine drainage metagenome TaxID=410659 RepID=A0A1J5Q416_9ZZZZ
MILGRYLVTTAVITEGFAERNVEIQRDRLIRALSAAAQFFGVVLRAEPRVHAVGGGVGGIAWAGNVETLKQFGPEVERLIHHNE